MAATQVTASTFISAIKYVICPSPTSEQRVERVRDCVKEFFVDEAESGRTYGTHKKVALREAVKAFIESERGLAAALQSWLVKRGYVDASGNGSGVFGPPEGQPGHPSKDRNEQSDVPAPRAPRRAEKPPTVEASGHRTLFDLIG